MISLKDKIQEMAGDADITDFDNLILDETPMERLSADDKKYLEQFAQLEMISMNICRLQALDNFPTLPSLTRIELADNQIKGSDLTHLTSNINILTLKLGNNKIATVAELQCLSSMTKLRNLDLEGNPVQDTPEYKPEDIFTMIPSLEVLDMKTKEGEDAEDSEDEDDEYGGEEGEDEMDEAERVALLEEHLTDKQKAKLQAAGVTIQDYLAGNGPDLTDEDIDDDYDDEEEGEADEEEDAANGNPEAEGGVDGEKRTKED